MTKKKAPGGGNLDALRSWLKLNKVLNQLTEAEVSHLLDVERANKRRPMMVRRLHQRLNTLRVKRERGELEEKA